MEDLFAAIQAGDETAVRDMLRDEPSLAGERSPSGISAILAALYHRKPELAEILVSAGAPIDMFDAAALGRIDRLEDLAGNGEAWSGDGFTPLHLACFFGRLEAARWLLDHGALVDAEARNPMKVRPIHSAAASRKSDVVRMLVERGASVDAQQAGGWTALMAAALHGDEAMAKILVDAGADPRRRADDGRSALDMDASGRVKSLLPEPKPEPRPAPKPEPRREPQPAPRRWDPS